MRINLSEILEIYKQEDLDLFLKSNFAYDLTENNLTDDMISEKWKFVGDNKSNASSIDILKNGEKGVIERISNGIDAVLEKQKQLHGIRSSRDSNSIISKAFPKFYERRKEILSGKKNKKIYAFEASDQVILAINSSRKSNKPTFDIIDRGTGIHGDDFASTILSLHGGNKIHLDKSYLIGAFGQGGSTSLSFAESTIIISKLNNKYFFTIVKRVNLRDYKNHCYVYLVNDKKIIELYDDIETSTEEYLNIFLKSDSGTLVRMIETDVAKKYRDNDITKPTMFSDYLNTELFNVPLPIKVIENRIEYKGNVHAQNRYSYGSKIKLQTWKYKREEFSGTIEIEHKNNIYNIDYFAILPDDEDKWGSDSECKKIYSQLNVHNRPIIYTVNGQYINGERFLKLKNAGLTFLEHRLFVVIDLDILGAEKYKFFTPDRSQIKDTDITSGFIDKVINVLAKEDRLIRLNEIIGQKSLSSKIDSELIDNIARNVSNLYNRYLKAGGFIKRGGGGHPTPNVEDIYYDEIQCLEITTKKDQFKIDEEITIILKTNANKVVNQNAPIYTFLNGKYHYPTRTSFLNGRIIFTFSRLKPDNYNIFFELFDEIHLKSNEHNFIVTREKSTNKNTTSTQNLPLKINLVDEKEVICDVAKTKDEIIVSLCLDHDEMLEVYRYRNSAQIDALKSSLIEPIVLFALFMDESYDNIENVNEKNKLIVSFAKTKAALE